MATMIAAGLLWSLTALPHSQVNHGYFRSSLLVVLGLTALGTVAGWTDGSGILNPARIATALFAYGAFFCWNLERPLWGKAMQCLGSATALLAVVAAALPIGVGTSRNIDHVAVGSTVAGTAVVGISMGAMLLGHYYLTAPWMSLKPIFFLLAGLAGTTLVRAVFLAGESTGWSLQEPMYSDFECAIQSTLRWGIGIIGILALCIMTYRTLRLGATQAATGILYVVVIFALTGETAGLIFRAMAERRSFAGEAPW